MTIHNLSGAFRPSAKGEMGRGGGFEGFTKNVKFWKDDSSNVL